MEVKLLYWVRNYEENEKCGVYKGKLKQDDFDLLQLFIKDDDPPVFGNGTTIDCILLSHFSSEYPPTKWVEGKPVDENALFAALRLPSFRQAVNEAILNQWCTYTAVFGPEPDLEAEYTYEYLSEYLKQRPASARLHRKYVSKSSRDESLERSVKQ